MSLHLNRETINRDFMNYLTGLNEPFDVTMSNYSIAIYPDDNGYKRFVDSIQSKRMFAAFAKIKSDLKGKKVPKLRNSDVKYFYHDFKKDFYSEEIFCIDIKSAYANVLKSKKLISEETFNYLSTLPKKDRLASVGMLASKKRHYRFDGKDYKFLNEEENPLAGFFYLAAKGTFDIMSKLKQICGNDYLFTWVDCIYFKANEEVMSNCLCYMENISFPYSPEVLNNFSVENRGNHILVQYEKQGHKKSLMLPIKRYGYTITETEIKKGNSIFNNKNRSK